MKTLYARPLLAAVLAVTLVGGPASPAFAQDAPQNPQPAPAKTAAPILPVSLGSAKYKYSRAPKAFPNIIAPYSPIRIDAPGLTNSPRIDQLIHDGKLELSLQEAVELALENSMDIVVQRYNPWIVDTGILKAQAGGFGVAGPGAAYAGSNANTPLLSYDPLVTSTITIDDRKIPVNNPLTSGTGTGLSALAALSLHTTTINTQVSQGIQTGTTFFAAWDNTRNSSTSAANLFNPSVQTSIFAGFQQQLLNGFGRAVNTRNIRIA
jgi:outer membrane protein